ncbi:hypothetical protein HMPREF1015_02811 [Bacillus smithii 7_3_47FAA]|uniref:Ribosomal RNA small subunit methyltransferase I n=1 Tax=Bacillus smithii 7_3_47FAA TaxID=665952 RepID=G9QGP7_9BACI|nr:hypothetical protein HMPREF1015_02811 [Bacillus smithii 7_3_47FAA]
MYESPHRLKETLEYMLDILGNRPITLCRELTKKFEEFLRGDIKAALNWVENEKVMGEFCLILEGAKEQEAETGEKWWESLSIVDHVNFYIDAKKMDAKEAVKQTAKDRNMPKREVYQMYHNT